MLLLLGCTSPEPSTEITEQLQQFRAGLPQVHMLSGGGSSPEAMARAYLDAVSRRDTSTLSALQVSRAEFAWLVYPNHIYRDPPFEFEPAVLWRQIRKGSDSGLAVVLARYGGQRIAFSSVRCERDRLQLPRGPLSLWGECHVAFIHNDSVTTAQLFWSLVEQAGTFKFLNFKNRL